MYMYCLYVCLAFLQWYTHETLKVDKLLNPIARETVVQNTYGMPNAHFASDHMSLCCDLLLV